MMVGKVQTLVKVRKVLIAAVAIVVLSGLMGVQGNDPVLARLSDLVAKRDIKTLNSLVLNDPETFNVLNGGPYGGGEKGWTVLEGTTPVTKRRFFVVSTPLTSQDIGEILLMEEPGGKLTHIDESFDFGAQLQHHKLKVGFNIGLKQAIFSDTIRVKSEAAGEFVFRMSPCYKVRNVEINGIPAPFAQAGGVVVLPSTQEPEFDLKVDYAGIVDLPNYAGSITKENVQLTNDYWYPMIARKPATVELEVTAPADFTVVTMGDKVAETRQGENKVWKYKLDQPVTYWSLTAAKLKESFQTLNGVRLGMWSPRVSLAKMKDQAEFYAPIIALYSRAFGKYPFAQYGALDSPTYGGGALEAYTFATYGGGLPTEDPHEPSHTWWGGLINNTYLGSFWNESFAVYSEGFYYQNAAIRGEPAPDRKDAFVVVNYPGPSDAGNAPALAGAAKGPVAADMGYGKGARVLAMLDQLVGTKNLTDCMKEWVRTHPVGQAGDWEDFVKILLRRLPSYDLEEFVNQWLLEPGVVELELRSVTWQKGILSGQILFKGAKKRVPVEIAVEGTDKVVRFTTIDSARLSSGGAFQLPLVKRPSRIALDPRHRTLRKGTPPRYPSFVELGRSLKTVRLDTNDRFGLGTAKVAAAAPADSSGSLLVGDPRKVPALDSLLKSAGITRSGDNLTYQGRTVSLNAGGACGVITLPSGKNVGFACGNVRYVPNIGRARLALVDELGRYITGKTDLPLNTAWQDVYAQ